MSMQIPKQGLVHCRREGVSLVQLGEQYGLVDAIRERIVILNVAGASIWAQLEAAPALVAEHKAFVAALRREGLLQDRPSSATPLPCIPAHSGLPEILAVAPLQVAANNSGDPFAGTGW
jgi:hypothetical protein